MYTSRAPISSRMSRSCSSRFFVLCDLIFLLLYFEFAITDELCQVPDPRPQDFRVRRHLIPLPSECVDGLLQFDKFGLGGCQFLISLYRNLAGWLCYFLPTYRLSAHSSLSFQGGDYRFLSRQLPF